MNKKCVNCGELKPLTSFHKKSAAKDGRQPACSVCTNAWHKSYRESKGPRRKARGKHDYPSLTTTTKDDWCVMYSYLTKMGYNVFEDIHQQFLDKHGFVKYKKKDSKYRRLWNPEDCLECLEKTNPFTD
jgi:hypothetical protein